MEIFFYTCQTNFPPAHKSVERGAGRCFPGVAVSSWFSVSQNPGQPWRGWRGPSAPRQSCRGLVGLLFQLDHLSRNLGYGGKPDFLKGPEACLLCNALPVAVPLALGEPGVLPCGPCGQQGGSAQLRPRGGGSPVTRAHPVGLRIQSVSGARSQCSARCLLVGPGGCSPDPQTPCASQEGARILVCRPRLAPGWTAGRAGWVFKLVLNMECNLC